MAKRTTKKTESKAPQFNEIIDAFFEQWTQRSIAWFERKIEEYSEAHRKLSAKFAHETGYSKEHSAAYRELTGAWLRRYGAGTMNLIEYSPLRPTPGQCKSIEEHIRQNNEARKARFYAKVEALVGPAVEIVEANLHQGDDGTPNGWVKGSKGAARITTIAAGGWNTQCFHYRVLVKPLKETK